jgi:hypothetical protein
VIEAVQQKGRALQYASEEIKDDATIVLEAVKQHGEALWWASERLKDDADIVMEAVKESGWALIYASERLRDDETLVMEAVKVDGYILEHAPDRLQDDAIIVMEAVKQKGDAIVFASERLQDDETLVMEAVKQNGDALEYASARLQDDDIVVLIAMKASIGNCMYASERLQKNVSFVTQGINESERLFDPDCYCTKKFIYDVLKPMCLSLQVTELIASSNNLIESLSFVENQGKDVAKTCAKLCNAYCAERIWLLSQVSEPIPATVVMSIDSFCGQDLSRKFLLANDLVYYAPILSALENKGITWKEILQQSF